MVAHISYSLEYEKHVIHQIILVLCKADWSSFGCSRAKGKLSLMYIYMHYVKCTARCSGKVARGASSNCGSLARKLESDYVCEDVSWGIFEVLYLTLEHWIKFLYFGVEIVKSAGHIFRNILLSFHVNPLFKERVWW